jgi:glycolate oxidase FAD binding subunit
VSGAVAALQALATDLGVAVEIVSHEPVAIDGVPVGVTLRPRDADALARTLRAVSERGLAVVPVGGGRHLGLGNVPRRVDALLSTVHLSGVDACEPAEGVCHAGAGTRLGALRARVAESGWELPLDAPDDASLGGALATAAVGPRSLGFGAPRDVVLGLEVVLGSGERTHCGGRVVKNVTGYDLPRLYTGSLGSLCVIEGAWLRLRPRPERTRRLALPERPTAAALVAGIAASRLASARACVLRGSAQAGLRGVVELAGAVATVDRDAAWLVREHGASEAGSSALDAASDTDADLAGKPGVRFRIPALPSHLSAALAALGAGVPVVVHPGLRLLYASFTLADADDAVGAARAFEAAAAAARQAAGGFRCEAAPPAAKRGRDVFGPAAAELPLVRALKQRFDPRGVLSPGRFVGCV